MKNLFVCHSQAQIILAIGLTKGRFKDEFNALILFKDFCLTQELLENLKKIFNSVSVRKGLFPKKNKKWRNKTRLFIKDIIYLKHSIKTPYNKVFVVCDQNLQELYILKRARKLNFKTELIWLEDGSYPYFLNVENNHGLNVNRFTIKLRKVIFKYFFQLGDIYTFQGNYMSGNRNLKTAYLTLPNCARSIFQNKKLVEIERHEYLLGINFFYSTLTEFSYHFSDIIIVFDKFDTYQNLDRIKEISSYILKLAKTTAKKVLFKLHPREEETDLYFLDGAIELNRNFGFEFYIYNIIKKNPKTKVFGFKSTTLQIAKVFNLETISLFLFSGEENYDLCEFYNRLNIKLPENIEKLKSLI